MSKNPGYTNNRFNPICQIVRFPFLFFSSFSCHRASVVQTGRDYFRHLEFAERSRYGQREPFSSLNKPSLLEEGILMGQKASGWAIFSGCVLMLTGVCFLPAALGAHPDPAILAAGVCVFALGALVAAGGVYLKARALQAGVAAGPGKPQSKRVRGGCDLCGTDSPVINCRVHQLHLCGACVGEHYDFRSCVYVPSTRRPAPGKAPARFAAKA